MHINIKAMMKSQNKLPYLLQRNKDKNYIALHFRNHLPRKECSEVFKVLKGKN